MRPVQAVDAARNMIQGVTLAGIVTYQVPPETIFVGKDGKPGATYRGTDAFAACTHLLHDRQRRAHSGD